MASNPLPDKWQLWNPAGGIRFAATGRQPLYPELDLSRMLHGTSGEQISDRTAHPAAIPQTDEARQPAPSETEPSLTAASGTATSPAVDATADPKDKKETKTEHSDDEDLCGDPPTTTLAYKMPEDTFRAARLAAPGKPESFWSYTMYRGPSPEGVDNAKVKVHYCRSQHTTERVCQYFLKEKILGFDLEWMADAGRWQGARRNVCLAQLASESRIALFHLSLYPENQSLVAPSFRKIMENPEISKIGVNIKGDATRLKTFLGIEPRGLFELSHLYRLVTYSKSGDFGLINRKLVSLATQVGATLRLPMFKGPDVRSSNWSRPLGMDQIIYSASDAYAAVQLFDILEQKREALDPTPPRPHHAELNLPIRLADGVVTLASKDTEVDAEIKAKDKVTTTLPSNFVTSATEDISIEPETNTPEILPETPKRRGKTPTTPSKPKDERIVAAEVWLAEYRTSNTKPRAPNAALRAHRIWSKNADLDPVAIAKMLREPPLQTLTVVSYILQAITSQKLPYEKARLRKEVLGLLPKEVLDTRYKGLAKACADGS